MPSGPYTGPGVHWSSVIVKIIPELIHRDSYNRSRAKQRPLLQRMKMNCYCEMNLMLIVMPLTVNGSLCCDVLDCTIMLYKDDTATVCACLRAKILNWTKRPLGMLFAPKRDGNEVIIKEHL